MKKTTILQVVMAISIGLCLLSSCGSKKFAVSTNNENLSALTKVTNGAEPCIQPFGGDNGKNLFFASRTNKKYWNIYKKENAFTNAVSEKTSGKNQNVQPAYSPVTEKIAFKCQKEGASTADIYLINAEKGKALTSVAESSDASEGHPSFNSDGTMVVYDRTVLSHYLPTSTWAALFQIIAVR